MLNYVKIRKLNLFQGATYYMYIDETFFVDSVSSRCFKV
jgi:hypothetical protein